MWYRAARWRAMGEREVKRGTQREKRKKSEANSGEKQRGLTSGRRSSFLSLTIEAWGGQVHGSSSTFVAAKPARHLENHDTAFGPFIVLPSFSGTTTPLVTFRVTQYADHLGNFAARAPPSALSCNYSSLSLFLFLFKRLSSQRDKSIFEIRSKRTFLFFKRV